MTGNGARPRDIGPRPATSREMGDGYEMYTENDGADEGNGRMNDRDNRNRRSASISPGRGGKFRFVETAEENNEGEQQLARREQDGRGNIGNMQRRSPLINPVQATGNDFDVEPSPEGPTARFQHVGEETPTGRNKWTDGKEALLCSLWEDEEHLYNASMDDHRRIDRRHEAIRRIAARLGMEGQYNNK